MNFGRPGCTSCMNKHGEIARRVEEVNRLIAEKAGLAEQITNLQARLNERPPTDREFSDVKARMHQNARDEATARHGLAAVRNELQDALGRLASAERTAANLMARLRNAGLEPPAAPQVDATKWGAA